MPDIQSRLSRINTSWATIKNAVEPENDARIAAQEELIYFYSKAIRKYILAAVKDESAAEEIFQLFFLKLCSGEFSKADPEVGSFRKFVKRVLHNLVADHFRKLKRRPSQETVSEEIEQEAQSVAQIADDELQIYWRSSLLDHAWKQLRLYEANQGGIYYTALKSRVDNGNSSDQIEDIYRQTGKRLTPGSLRVNIHRAREKFSEFLVQAVINSLDDPTPERIDDEFVVLNLKKYRVCAEAIGKSQTALSTDKRNDYDKT